MNRVAMLVGNARNWWQRRFGGARSTGLRWAPDKTLKELMAEQGLDENGRKRDPSPIPPQTGPQNDVICIVEFSYDGANGSPGHTVLGVVRLDDRAFHGLCPRSGEMLSFPWSKVRGLVRLVDSGEMIEPRDVVARYS
ncbi:hypothetical protein [Pseudomonas oryzae]|uniref:Uncharacterized protein n=1 Tax=Pseudomonas oryzae TaxID=1392877 RepID=A0A1H1RXX8_9PSED|nr:hypothetical protein [Pseudomonas oryzae]SDS40564.1 hypothetical protein SAMN05216221_1745 [Pseudomonas oryzae]